MQTLVITVVTIHTQDQVTRLNAVLLVSYSVEETSCPVVRWHRKYYVVLY